MNSRNLKKYVKPVGNVICVVSVLFLIKALVKAVSRTDFDFSKITDWRWFLLLFALGTGLKTATVFLSAGAWCLWLEFFAKRRCDRKEALRVYAKANIGKYLPGNVMHYVERNLFAGKLQLSQKQMTAASICEIAGLVLAAFGMGTLFAFSKMREAWTAVRISDRLLKGWPIWIAAAAAVFLFVKVNQRIRLRTAEKKLSAADFFSFFRTFLACFCIYAAVLVVLGLILVMMYAYFGGHPPMRQALEMIAAYMAAWVLGFFIPGAPGGIGVREMVLTLLLTPVTGRDCIVLLSVWHRLVTVAGDFAAYLLRNLLTNLLINLPGNLFRKERPS